jgi:hypothetical protein
MVLSVLRLTTVAAGSSRIDPWVPRRMTAVADSWRTARSVLRPMTVAACCWRTVPLVLRLTTAAASRANWIFSVSGLPENILGVR